ncbi:MAG TPA: hypothetical protein VE994_06300 [Terriglobales bacterium]|nr:hypothetical protein [Terriglobales bacterium]
MQKRRGNGDDVIKRAKASRERAAHTAKKTTTLIHKAARLEETIRQTEERVRDLESIVGNKRPPAGKSRRRAG